MIRRLIASTAVCALLAACGSPSAPVVVPISGGGGAAPIAPPANIQADLAAAQANLVGAQGVGALSATDPAPACVTAVNNLIGVNTNPNGTPANVFNATEVGPASTGAVAYIKIQQLKQFLQSGQTTSVSAACEQLIGQIVIDAATLGAQGAAISGGIFAILPKTPAPAHYAAPKAPSKQ